MQRLQTFAFVHPLSGTQLRAFQDAFPSVRFLSADEGFPAGLEEAQAVAIHWKHPPMEELLARAKGLQWLHLRGAGIDRIAVPALVDSDIILTNGSGNHAPNIAEHVLSLMLAFARQLPALMRRQARRQWQPPEADEVFELSAQTALIVGLGAIGQELATRLSALGMRVVGVKRRSGPLPEGVQKLVTLDELDTVLPEADHVVIALPLTHATRNLFGAARLQRMRRGAYLYNVGRGPLVDHDALVDAIRAGHIEGAGLDVIDPEPLPPESPLWDMDRVIITAHSSGLTPRSYERFEALLMENIRRFSTGQPLLNVVDKAAGY
jgi:phosphoglycerate dehydrogenase-like enzyme